MQSIHSFLVKPKGGRRYNNTKKIGDVDFILSISPEDHTVTNREAEVLGQALAQTMARSLGPAPGVARGRRGRAADQNRIGKKSILVPVFGP